MFHYSAFNLRICSPIELPWLPPAENGSDIIITFAPRDPHVGPPPAMPHAFHVTPRLAILDYAHLGRLTSIAGRELRVTLLPDADESRLADQITGAALAVLLYQRGLLVLRAAAVVVRGAAVMFIAGPGGGKSTLAAKFCQEGHELLAEDVTAIDMSGACPRVIPATPLLRLDVTTAATLGLRLTGPCNTGKGASFVEQRFAAGPVPLRAAYCLRGGLDNNITYIPLRAGLTAVAHHSYPTCLLQPSSREQLRQCSHLVGAVPVCEFTRRCELSELGEQAQMIEVHLKSLPQARGGRSLLPL